MFVISFNQSRVSIEVVYQLPVFLFFEVCWQVFLAVTYQLDGKPPFDDPRIDTTATIITEAEYDELVAEFHPPDVDPEPDPEPEPEPVDPGDGAMSNAELTAAVQALTEELAAAKIMLGVE